MALTELVSKVAEEFHKPKVRKTLISLAVVGSLLAGTAFGSSRIYKFLRKEHESYVKEQIDEQKLVILTEFKNKDAGWVSKLLYEDVVKENFLKFLSGHNVKLLRRPTEIFLNTVDPSVPMPTYQIFVSGKGLFAVYLTDPIRRSYDFINDKVGDPLPDYMKEGFGKFKNSHWYNGYVVIPFDNSLKVPDIIYELKEKIKDP